jgi:hypothetical protein
MPCIYLSYNIIILFLIINSGKGKAIPVAGREGP